MWVSCLFFFESQKYQVSGERIAHVSSLRLVKICNKFYLERVRQKVFGALQVMWSLLQPLLSAVVAQKQPKGMHIFQ